MEQGLGQGCVLAPLLFNLSLAAVILHAFQGGQRHHGPFGTPGKEKGGGGRGEVTAGEPALATLLRGMIYADDAGVVSQSPSQLRKMLGVIVVVWAGFGLTASEAKSEVVCLRTKGMPASTATFSVEAAGQVYNHMNEFVYLGGNVNHNDDLSIEVNRRIRNAWCSLRKYILELYTTNRALPSSSKSGCPEQRYSRQCCTATSCGARARATTTHCAKPTTSS